MEKDFNLHFLLNNEQWSGDVDPDQSVLDFLRSLNFSSVKAGCRVGDCGICTVLLDGEPVRSCLLKIMDINDRSIFTPGRSYPG